MISGMFVNHAFVIIDNHLLSVLCTLLGLFISTILGGVAKSRDYLNIP